MTASRLLWLFVFASTLLGADLSYGDGKELKKPAPAAKEPAQAIFDRLKGLEGDWEATRSDDHVRKGQVVLHYRLTGGGSALTETIFPGTPKEMLSVYHRDGAELVMTHYCCMGNQPHLRARPGKDKNEVVLDFAGGTNLDPATDPHIHSGRIRFVDADHLHGEWDLYADGKLARTYACDLIKKK